MTDTTKQSKIDPMNIPRLMLCCLAEHDAVWDISRPFVRGGYLYCSDRNILARIEYPCYEDTKGNFPPVAEYDKIMAGADDPQWVDAEQVLKGARAVGDSELLAVPVGKQLIKPFYAALLAHYDAQIDTSEHIARAIRWRMCGDYEGADIEGVVMPCYPV